MNDPALLPTSPRRIRQSNSIAALQALFDHGRLSRAALARHLGLNRSSSGHIVAELAANALVREVTDEKPERSGRAGRPGILLELDPGAACFLGAEIGVEHIATLRIDLNAEITEVRIEPFDGRSVSASEAVRRAAVQAFEGLSPREVELVEGIGFSAPAQIDKRGRIQVAPLLGWTNVDLATLARETLGGDLPVMIENDANAFAFGEGYRGRRTTPGVTLFLVIETGVGGGVVIDGKLFRGGHGLAGEIGHMTLPGGEEVEAVLGLGHLLRLHAEVGGAGSLEAFLGEVRDRVPGAVGIAEAWARDLAHAIALTARVIDPNRIVLGGSVAALYPLVAARVAHYLAAAQAPTFPKPEIVVHAAAESGAAYGAACMLHQRFLSLENPNLTESAAGTPARDEPAPANQAPPD